MLCRTVALNSTLTSHTIAIDSLCKKSLPIGQSSGVNKDLTVCIVSSNHRKKCYAQRLEREAGWCGASRNTELNRRIDVSLDAWVKG